MTVNLEPPPGLSTWERDLFDHLVRHMREEDALVDEYERVATEAGGHVAYLLGLIVEDERRHHRLFEEWCNSLRTAAEFRDVEPQVPSLTRTKAPDDVADAVRTFLAVERSDQKDLARLKRTVKPERDVTLWSVLLTAMELDTQKHIALLRFLVDHPSN